MKQTWRLGSDIDCDLVGCGRGLAVRAVLVVLAVLAVALEVRDGVSAPVAVVVVGVGVPGLSMVGDVPESLDIVGEKDLPGWE